MNKRNLLALSMAVASTLGLASCGSKEVKVQVGLGTTYTFDEAKNQFDVTTAFVAFDEEGKIFDARIDVVQVALQANGTAAELTSAMVKNSGNFVKTKLEKGKDYNMKGVSALGIEVDNQIEFFADWSKGQKASELDGNDETLKASCSIKTADFINAIKDAEKAKSSTVYSVSKEAKAGVCLAAGLENSYGTYQVNVDMGGVLVADGKIVADAIDAIQLKLKVENNDVAPASTAFETKKDLHDRYAMKPTSPREWYEHAASIEEAALNQTADAVKDFTKEDFGSSITVTGYAYTLSQAAKYAVLDHVGPQA